MPTVKSIDGTIIAYEPTGNGPGIILVSGALAYRALQGEQELAASLSKNFTVIQYDRRGRGESGDSKEYSVEKEIEDIEALIEKAGEPVYLFGSSSGAALSLNAAQKLGAGKIKKLALYDAPYFAVNDESKAKFAADKQRVNECIKAGKPAEAVAAFFESIGTPKQEVEKLKESPAWKGMVEVGHTLAYDYEILGDGTIPIDVAKNVMMPTIVMDGEKSLSFMHTVADKLAGSMKNASRKTLANQTHQVSAEALAPVLKAFFV